MKRKYNILWKEFLKQEQEFKDYMGYGKEEIEKIGIEEFIDFMGWDTVEDIPKYKTDRIKAIPCCHCGSHITTFQLDMGLCKECKKKYNIKLLNEQIESCNDFQQEFFIVTSFVYFKDFRSIYLLDRDFEETLDACICIDNLDGAFTKHFLIDDVIGKNKISDFIDTVDKKYRTEDLTDLCRNNLLKIKTILIGENPKQKIRTYFKEKNNS